MEELLQEVSNEHRMIYYSSQLKIMDISQSLRTMGARLTQNQLKSLTTETLGVYYMLQSIFNQSKLPHIYQLIRHLNTNYNSVIALLLEKNAKLAQNQGEISKLLQIDKKDETIDSLANTTNAEGMILKQIKKNRLGGIHLYNDNYSKYLQDRRILQQIKTEKEQRLNKNKMDILRQSILAELEHKTDVQQNPAKNDQIALYVLQTKNKLSMFNYVSYEPELQEILTFFQNSQSEANNFLVKKSKISEESEGQFSFADIQRDVQLKNSEFKKHVSDKLNHFVSSYKEKQKQIEKYIIENQLKYKLLLDQKKGVFQAVQTDLGFDQYVKRIQAQSRQLSAKCCALESLKRQEVDHIEHENTLQQQIVIKDGQIQKLNCQIKDFEATLESVKKMLRDQKMKKTMVSMKDDGILKTERTIQRQMEKESIQISKQKSNIDSQKMLDEVSIMSSSSKLRKTSNINHSWRRKPSTDAISLMAAQDLEEGESLDRHQKKKIVRYNVEENEPHEKLQSLANLSKFKKPKSMQQSTQTQTQIKDQIVTQIYQRPQRRLKSSKKIIIQNPIDTSQQNQGEFIPLPIKSNKKIENSQKIIQKQKSQKSLKKINAYPLVQVQESQKKQIMLAVQNFQKKEDSINQKKDNTEMDNNVNKINSSNSSNKSAQAEYKQSILPVNKINTFSKPKENKQIDTSINKISTLSKLKENKEIDINISKINTTSKMKESNEPEKNIINSNEVESVKRQITKVKDQKSILSNKKSPEINHLSSSGNSLKAPQIQIQNKMVVMDKEQRLLPPSQDKKQQLKYKIYEVTEQEGEQVQESMRTTQRSGKLPFLKSVHKLQADIIQKLTKEAPKCQKKWEYNHLYSITILPVRYQHQKMNLYLADSMNEKYCTQSYEYIDQIKDQNKNIRPEIRQKIVKLFQNLPKLEGIQNQAKREKLRIWKKKLISNFKSDIISQQQLQQILLVLGYKSLNGIDCVPQNNAPSPKPSATNRSSLPEEQLSKNESLKSSVREIRRAKQRSTFSEQNEVINSKKYVQAEFEQQLHDLIRNEANQSHFSSKFHQIHQKCGEGPICTHIIKYFETIMKCIEQKSQKNHKQSAIQHVENIGRKNVVEIQALQFQRRNINKSQQHLQTHNKQNQGRQFAHKKGTSLYKVKSNKQLMLPLIREPKVNAAAKK